ncbi:FMN-dependent NADH-azoreductase [Anabaena sp. FACHB-709]|uniref:FMN-dependent NADH:quinone oxidoreductase n=3 Tax=Nostocaceae TaxID=1162 RepID=AZOR_NOSS1|nr:MULTISPECIES: FMN-dependent NADH-azoreductase [Nostocaceae]Q8YV76.1 RecName: Full=FMN-dependent NADH:quinone oxidoreductase; AltName: Full=Azo-dye reductase; AltName: Full=FMN-dependent NADH-azo compound oxidoreductase; AltName: Full=FMN-dependent NADH-azoreductase [Nostoc sp. PCC 7120 = FACHB-418]BAY67725.1 acyl carrier protein phosphodiesterase [Trichormus variabilis NIES-23]HBW30459.1 FMN-dependent NADH-azoreductase [Nostoc sp. UBA8866]MBD2170179.1 FMN-dependent NADH-azoreductase [Anabaen
MANILHIDSSPRGDRSISRKLSYEFITSWKDTHPGDTVTYRDLGHNPVPHVDEPWIAAAFSSPESHTPELKTAIELSDTLIDEFLAADRLVFGVPMYNLNIPSTFKAYIDQIVRAGKTFTVDANGYKGLVDSSKKVLIITSRGGSYPPGTPYAAYDYQEPYLRAILGFMGLTDVTFIHAESLNMGEDAREKSLAGAKDAIAQAVANW